MPVLAFCEKGLILDVFGPKPARFKSEQFKIGNNTVASVFKDKVSFIDLKSAEVINEIIVSDMLEMRLSKDGRKYVVLTHGKKLQVYKDFKMIMELENVENVEISDCFLCISTKSSTRIFNFEDKHPEAEIKVPLKSFYVFNTLVVLLTEKEESQKIIVYKGGVLKTLFELESIYRVVIECNEDESKLLLLVGTVYTKDSYYADSTLFFLTYTDIDKAVEACEPENETDQEGDKNKPVKNKTVSKTVSAKKSKEGKEKPSKRNSSVPALEMKNVDFALLSFKGLKKIHAVKFLKDTFYVCFGNQPASLYLFNLNAIFQKKYPKAIRNLAIFNTKENRIINAGLGNLPGNIEVQADMEVTCNFELLGSSIVSWLNNDCHFMIAITNYFKSENKISIYDYYGRLLEEMTCNSLICAAVYGDLADEVAVQVPEKIIKPLAVAAYVPPHLQGNPAQAKKAKPHDSKQKKVEMKRTVEAIKKELEECLNLREKLRKGEELSLSDENKVFKIKKLEEELEKLLNN
ncbi:hypothetical protein GINT2_000265 [Glugoides intestinalis]